MEHELNEVTYRQITFGWDEPDYAIISTPYGPVEITRKRTFGNTEAIKWVDDLCRD